MSDEQEKAGFLDGFTLAPDWAKKSSDSFSAGNIRKYASDDERGSRDSGFRHGDRPEGRRDASGPRRDFGGSPRRDFGGGPRREGGDRDRFRRTQLDGVEAVGRDLGDQPAPRCAKRLPWPIPRIAPLCKR